jgi:hypothetical protein
MQLPRRRRRRECLCGLDSDDVFVVEPEGVEDEASDLAAALAPTGT